MTGRGKALSWMALRVADEVLRIEHEWQKERGGSTSAFDACCELEAIANWYRGCLQAVGGAERPVEVRDVP